MIQLLVMNVVLAMVCYLVPVILLIKATSIQADWHAVALTTLPQLFLYIFMEKSTCGTPWWIELVENMSMSARLPS